MKKELLGLLAIVITLISTARGEDVRLASGRVLYGATIYSVHPDGVVILPKGAPNPTKYPWAWINSEDAARLRTAGEKQARLNTAVAEIKRNSDDFTVTVKQVIEGGVIATITAASRSQTPGGDRPLANVINETAFIHMKDTFGISDGYRTTLRLYLAGTYKFTNVLGAGRTIPAMATSADEALDAISRQARAR